MDGIGSWRWRVVVFWK